MEIEKEIEILNKIREEYYKKVSEGKNKNWDIDEIKELEEKKIILTRKKIEEFFKTRKLAGKLFLIVYRGYLGSDLFLYLKNNQEKLNIRQSEKGNFIVIEENKENFDLVYSSRLLEKILEDFRKNFKDSVILRNAGVFVDHEEKNINRKN